MGAKIMRRNLAFLSSEDSFISEIPGMHGIIELEKAERL